MFELSSKNWYILSVVGNDLKEWREKMKWSQENLARVLDISSSTVARWEQLKDKEIPNSKMLSFALVGIKHEVERTTVK